MKKGPFSMVEYSVMPGQYQEYLTFENPLDGKIILGKPLDFETIPVMTIEIKAQEIVLYGIFQNLQECKCRSETTLQSIINRIRTKLPLTRTY